MKLASLQIHEKKYGLLKKDAENGTNSEMTRINAYFNAAFHAIEAVAAKKNLHVNKHGLVRHFLEEHAELFEAKTEVVWRAFQELENQIRPGQVYGGAINGEKLEQAKRLFRAIEECCFGEGK